MSNSLVKIEVGRCPTCDNICETADGLQQHWCAAGHDRVRFQLVDTYAMDARKAWED